MKVILVKEVKSLGKHGKICEVSDGYARNYLIPRGLAVVATDGNVQDLAHKQKQEELKLKREKDKALELAEELENATITVKVKTGEKGRLFGSVTNKEISEVLEKEYNIKVDKRKIEMKDSLKTVGSYTVSVKIHSEVSASLKINIESL